MEKNQSSSPANQPLEKMYGSEDHLAVRIRTHELYTDPPHDYHALVLDNIPWQGNETVLDVGCGAGSYIQPVMDRLGEAGMLISADLSLGMLRDVSQKPEAGSTNLMNADAQQIPLVENSCDIVLANHMLYHVPDILQALQEIRRVLRPGGFLIAATNSKESMLSLVHEIETAYRELGIPMQIPPTPPRTHFSLEDGGEILEMEFSDVEIFRQESYLVFPDAEPVIAYISSMRSYYLEQLKASQDTLTAAESWEKMLHQVEAQIGEKIVEHGAYRVSKCFGVFIARNLPADGVATRAGFVAVMGRPNVGKSTLINALMGQKIAAVSPRPQTTRQNQLGIITSEATQIIFIDTPGLHKPHHKLGRYMNEEAASIIEESDLILFLVDASESSPHEEDQILVQLLQELKSPPPVILGLNKADRLNQEERRQQESVYQLLIPTAELHSFSAIQRKGLESLLAAITSHLPESAFFYPEDQVTDLYEREIAADLIREAALLHLRDEIPHAVAIRVDEYTEREDHGAYIAATLFVERDSQKGIVIGKGGKMLKRIGSTSRQEIEKMSGRKIFLRLRVKVRKNWRNDEKWLRRFGFQKH